MRYFFLLSVATAGWFGSEPKGYVLYPKADIVVGEKTYPAGQALIVDAELGDARVEKGRALAQIKFHPAAGGDSASAWVELDQLTRTAPPKQTNPDTWKFLHWMSRASRAPID